jgi:hypothetical protein
MKRIQKLELVSQPFSLVRSWRRWVTGVECLYGRRVLRPVWQWRDNGARPGFCPRLPWWHRFVYLLLVLVGRLPYSRRLRRGEPRPVPQVRRGARVFHLYPELVFSPGPRQQQWLVWQRFQVEWELRQVGQRAQRWRR